MRGYDIDPNMIAPLDEPGVVDLYSEAPFPIFEDLAEAVSGTTMSFVVVPTPSNPDGGFSDAAVYDAVTGITNALLDNTDSHVIVVCSTVMPGTLTELRNEVVEESDGDFDLCYSPEFIALGSVIHDMSHPDLVLIGADADWAADALNFVLRSVYVNEPAVAFLSIVEAEIAKLAVNAQAESNAHVSCSISDSSAGSAAGC